MELKDTARADVLVFRGGGGVLSLFGVPFFLAGLGVIALTIGLLPTGDAPPLFFGVPFGLIFVLVGGGLIFGRQGCEIDRQNGTIERWWSCLVTLRRVQYETDEFDRVTLSREVRRSNNSSYTVFPVRMQGVPELKLDLSEPRRYQPARRQAEQVASFLHLPLADSSSGSEVVREPDHLNESLRDRLRRTGETPALPEAPAALSCRIRSKGDSVMIEMLVPSRFFKRDPDRVIVSPQEGLTWQPSRGKQEQIAVQDLEEVTLPEAEGADDQLAKVPKPLASLLASQLRKQMGITVRSDEKTVQFGGQLDEGERRYVYQLIRHVIAS